MDGVILKQFVEQRKINKTRLAKELSMSKTNLYQLFESKEFKPDTIKLLEKRFKIDWDETRKDVNIDVSRATEPEAVFKPNTTVPDRSIYKMAESNMVLSEAHKALADAHYLLAKNNENLISLVIGSVGIGKSKADPPIPIAVLELLAEEATENNYKSKEEALAAFRRIAHGGLKKKKEAGIRQSSGK